MGLASPWRIPLHDEKTLELLGQGRTTGVFQLESELFQDLLKQLKPASFTDIVALLALGRPGPLSMFGEFAARRRDPSRISYLHPELEEILGETYGLILYQEQVMAIAHRLGVSPWEKLISCAETWPRAVRTQNVGGSALCRGPRGAA